MTLTYPSESGTLLALAKWVARALPTCPTCLILRSFCFLPSKEVPHLKRGRKGEGGRERTGERKGEKEGRRGRCVVEESKGAEVYH